MVELSSIANLQCDAFIDALSACGSHPCLQQLGNLINSGRAPESLYASLALLPNPTKDIMDSIATFIDTVPLHGKLAFISIYQYDYQLKHFKNSKIAI